MLASSRWCGAPLPRIRLIGRSTASLALRTVTALTSAASDNVLALDWTISKLSTPSVICALPVFILPACVLVRSFTYVQLLSATARAASVRLELSSRDATHARLSRTPTSSFDVFCGQRQV
ncbi:hypothetical protein FA95DRAFT_1389409 [Auriscalpium vulgare]|uniref:Uncharacterized protein n=1 Tax=Auriscalpium vulgare TaxID=40419 RepID=A0ACB8S6Z5_9AGAM|nr:hypothetical protein FA95DRAFT_1389409 [Auriscalpium vulgare]